jgi:hypothetical protein
LKRQEKFQINHVGQLYSKYTGKCSYHSWVSSENSVRISPATISCIQKVKD